MRTVLALVLFLAAAGPAQAGLNVCNKAKHALKVAVGRFDGKNWVSEGWWRVEPKACAELVPGKLVARYYYMYATDSAVGTWDGGKFFCTATADKFAIVGRGACAAHGYDRRGFFEIDTANRYDYTQALSD
jgi:uncharacterized membrane protein